MNAKERILAERKRQIEVEGYSLEEDDKYVNNELADAGYAYFNNEFGFWPWDISTFKPTNLIRNLEKAGALFHAEIGRCERAGIDDIEPKEMLERTIAKLDEELNKSN